MYAKTAIANFQECIRNVADDFIWRKRLSNICKRCCSIDPLDYNIIFLFHYFGSKDDIEACSGLYNFIASLNNILTTRYLLFKGKML